MLRTLELRDFAIVDALELELAGGFNALTGETGAGKSILVDALSLLSGGRADGGMIRAEREAALVQGAFEGASFTSAARRLARNGRHSARIDGEIVTVAELAEPVPLVGQALVRVAQRPRLPAPEPRRGDPHRQRQPPAPLHDAGDHRVVGTICAAAGLLCGQPGRAGHCPHAGSRSHGASRRPHRGWPPCARHR